MEGAFVIFRVCKGAGIGAFEQLAVMHCMSLRHEFRLAAIGQLCASISTRRIEQPISHRYSAGVCGNQRLGDQLSQRFDDLRFIGCVIGRDRVSGYQREAADEDRKSPEHRPFGVGEEVMAPVERRA
jgi:hypothetical protein